MHTRNSQAMQSDPVVQMAAHSEEVQMAHSEAYGGTVAAIDMALGSTRDMMPLVSQLTRDSDIDIIMLCNTQYMYLHSHVAFLPRDWAKRNVVDSFEAKGKSIVLSDVMLYKTEFHVMDMIWRELRRTPIERSMPMAQGALSWCPGLIEDDKYTCIGSTRHADWVKI